MGVPSLFAYLNRKYGQVTFLRNKVKSKFDNILYFDFNCLIHPIVNDIIDNTLNSRDFSIQNHNTDTFHALIFSKIRDYTDHIINMVENPALIYIVFDGVAPRAKMNQQRSRRFLSVKNNSPERRALFDTNCISPGTEFMNQLSLFLHSYYDDDSRVIISDTLDAGEAEHKIMRSIRENSNNEMTHIIYGLDADLIMLSLCCNKNIKLLRENTLTNTTEFLLYHIAGVKKCIITEIYTLVENEYSLKLNKHIVIKDLVYLTFFVGNDFMPAINGLEINKNGIDYIISIYTEMFNKYQGDFRIMQGNKLNHDFLVEFLMELHTIISIDLGYTVPKNDYYSKISQTNEMDNLINKVCFSYIKTSLWTFQYYHNWCPSFSWFYSYHYPPLLSDLITYLQLNTISPKFDNAYPVSPEMQLLCILPKQSKSLIREDLHCVFERFPEMYPDDYQIDLNGKKYEWQSVVKLPFLSIESIVKYLN